MLKLIIVFAVLTLSVNASRHKHFYRNDYTYFEDYDAFYKLHWDVSGNSWNTAFMACDDEGSQLFYPKEEGEWTVVKTLMSAMTEAPNTTDVIVGIQDETGLGEFLTVDGQSTPTPLITDTPTDGQNCVLMSSETGAYSLDSCVSTDPTTWRVFVCKKIDEKPCPTVDLGYKYSKESKKCYKLNKRAKSWKEAWHTCFMEGAILVVPENNVEIDFISKMIPSEEGHFAGFRRMLPENSYYTVKGKKLGDSGFPNWRRPEDAQNDCGVIIRNYEYKTLYIMSEVCQIHLPFVCEMQARI